MRVVLVEERRLYAEAIKLLLEHNDFDVVGTTSMTIEAIDLAERTKCDIVLIDLRLPDANQLAERLDELLPHTKIIGTLPLGQKVPGDPHRAYAGHLSKDLCPERFISSIRKIANGSRVDPPRTERSGPTASVPADLLARQLTMRELEVLTLLAEGVSSRELADRLNVSINTARGHVQSILTKLNVHSRLEATAFAVREGLVMPGLNAVGTTV